MKRTRMATMLPAAVAREHEALFQIRLQPEPPQRTAALLQRKGAYRSAAAKAFVATALEVVG